MDSDDSCESGDYDNDIQLLRSTLEQTPQNPQCKNQTSSCTQIGSVDQERKGCSVVELREAIKRNRELQAKIKVALDTIRQAQNVNNRLRQYAKSKNPYPFSVCIEIPNHIRSLRSNTQVSSHLSRFSYSSCTLANTEQFKRSPNSFNYFSNSSNDFPPPNRDTKKKMEQKTPLTYRVVKWSDIERKNLVDVIRQAHQIKLMNEIAKHPNGHLNLGSLSSIDDMELAETAKQENWDDVARRVMSQHTGKDCMIQWTSVDNPCLNHNHWRKDEESKLIALAEKYKRCYWEKIAQELGTDRSPVACMIHFQSKLNPRLDRGQWTSEEDAKLKEAVEIFGDKNWQQCANFLESHRTGQQCMHRWQKTLRSGIKKGRWSEDEDKKLRLAVHAYGTRWALVQQHVQTRTDMQCRERWCNILDPQLNPDPWTNEEDEKLQSLVQEHGTGKWSKIAEFLSPRTDNQCWRRWKLLHQNEIYLKKRHNEQLRRIMSSSFPFLYPTIPLTTPFPAIAQNQVNAAMNHTSTQSSPISPTQSTLSSIDPQITNLQEGAKLAKNSNYTHFLVLPTRLYESMVKNPSTAPNTILNTLTSFTNPLYSTANSTSTISRDVHIHNQAAQSLSTSIDISALPNPIAVENNTGTQCNQVQSTNNSDVTRDQAQNIEEIQEHEESDEKQEEQDKSRGCVHASSAASENLEVVEQASRESVDCLSGNSPNQDSNSKNKRKNSSSSMGQSKRSRSNQDGHSNVNPPQANLTKDMNSSSKPNQKSSTDASLAIRRSNRAKALPVKFSDYTS